LLDDGEQQQRSRSYGTRRCGYDNRTSLILFRHPGVNALVQCGILYDVTRAQRTVVNCYELR
jgi:hypothetical protein